jgi:hypothetical protein
MDGFPLIAIIVSSVAAFFLGAIWYSPRMFGSAWKQEAHIAEETLVKQKQKPGLLYGATFLLTLIGAAVLAILLGPEPSITAGIWGGIGVGVGCVAASMGMNVLYEGKNTKLLAINAGYHIARFTLIGFLLALLQ